MKTPEEVAEEIVNSTCIYGSTFWQRDTLIKKIVESLGDPWGIREYARRFKE